MYRIRVTHVPGYSTDRDHLFPDYQSLIEQGQRPGGYPTSVGARRAFFRLHRDALARSTFNGHLTFTIVYQPADTEERTP